MPEEHVVRMNEESEALNEKINKLEDFIKSNPVFETLDVHDQSMMRDQLEYMDRYLAVLDLRIVKAEGKYNANN